MNQQLTIATLTLLSFAACGPAGAKVGSKQAAAESVYALSKPTNAAANRAASPIDLTDLGYTCPQGGSAKLSNFGASVDVGGGGVAVAQTFDLSMSGCGLADSTDGKVFYDGTVKVTQQVKTSGGSVSVVQSFKGTVTMSGAISDSLATDISQTVSVGASQTAGASVAEILKGTVTTAGGSYTFDESVTVQDGTITIVATSK